MRYCTYAAGVTIKLKSEPMRLDKAIAMCTKKLRLLRETLQINTNQALKDELHDMEDLTSALRQASVDAGASQIFFFFFGGGHLPVLLPSLFHFCITHCTLTDCP